MKKFPADADTFSLLYIYLENSYSLFDNTDIYHNAEIKQKKQLNPNIKYTNL
jgi:hypothetical protein